MNKYDVSVHVPIKVEPGYFEDDLVELAHSYVEEIDADYFSATTPNTSDSNGLASSYGLSGVRFYIGDEMVAFFDQSLRLSVVKILDEDDDERE